MDAFPEIVTFSKTTLSRWNIPVDVLQWKDAFPWHIFGVRSLTRKNEVKIQRDVQAKTVKWLPVSHEEMLRRLWSRKYNACVWSFYCCYQTRWWLRKFTLSLSNVLTNGTAIQHQSVEQSTEGSLSPQVYAYQCEKEYLDLQNLWSCSQTRENTCSGLSQHLGYCRHPKRVGELRSFQNSADLTETNIHENGGTSLSEKIWEVGMQHSASQLKEKQMAFLVVFAGDQLQIKRCGFNIPQEFSEATSRILCAVLVTTT